MQETAHSDIRQISSLSEGIIERQEQEPFTSFDTPPWEAHAGAVAKKKTLFDKRTTLKEAVSRHLKDGINIGIGGFVNTRTPVAIIHEIIRQGARDLTLSFQSHSICCELLAGAMILMPEHLSISRIELAGYGNEIIGSAPLFRYLTRNGMIGLDEYTDYGMAARFKAGAMGVPFLPTRDHRGSALELANRSKVTRCPFTGENILLVPACRPDLGIIHVQAADMYGNSRIFGAPCSCPEIAQASVDTIITAEQIIPDSSIRKHPNLTQIPYPVVDALVHQPFGATPGACYGNYWFDMPYIHAFRETCEEFCKTGNTAHLRAFYDKQIFDVDDFDEFLEQKPYPVLKDLCHLDGDQSIILD